MEILERFHESMPNLLKNQEGEVDHYFGKSKTRRQIRA
jgi:hypothetical protein